MQYNIQQQRMGGKRTVSRQNMQCTAPLLSPDVVGVYAGEYEGVPYVCGLDPMAANT